jgi:hypothetical protein
LYNVETEKSTASGKEGNVKRLSRLSGRVEKKGRITEGGSAYIRLTKKHVNVLDP